MRRPQAPGGTSPQRARAARSTSCSIILERGVHGGAEALLRGRFNGAAGGGAGREAGAAGPASGLGPAAKAHRAPRPRHPRATPSVPRLRTPGRRRPAPPPSRSRAPERCPEVVPVSAPGGLGCSSPWPWFVGRSPGSDPTAERSRIGAGTGKSRHKQGTTFTPSPTPSPASAGAGPGLGLPGARLWG